MILSSMSSSLYCLNLSSFQPHVSQEWLQSWKANLSKRNTDGFQPLLVDTESTMHMIISLGYWLDPTHDMSSYVVYVAQKIINSHVEHS